MLHFSFDSLISSGVQRCWSTLLILLMFAQFDPICPSSGSLACRTEVIANTDPGFNKTLKKEIKFQSLSLYIPIEGTYDCDADSINIATCQDKIYNHPLVSSSLSVVATLISIVSFS